MIILLLLVAGPFLINSLSISEVPKETRLSNYIKPDSYIVYLKTYLPGYDWTDSNENLTFTTKGHIILYIITTVPTDEIKLHSDGLHIDEVSAGIVIQKVSGWRTEEESQLLIINFYESLPVNRTVSIHIYFRGNISKENLKGHYWRESDDSEENDTKEAITQYETIAARKIVPCFDDPRFKARWLVRLEYPNGAVPLTNLIESKTMQWSNEFQLTAYNESDHTLFNSLAIFIGDPKYKERMTDKELQINSDEESDERIRSQSAFISLPATGTENGDSSKKCEPTCDIDMGRRILHKCRCKSKPSSGRLSTSEPFLLLFSLLLPYFFS